MTIGYNPHLGYEDKVLRDYEKMVHSVANKFRGSTNAGVDYEDLVSVGTIGLIEAFRNYDPDRYQGKVTSFGTYAFPMIKWSIQRFLRDKRNTVRVPRLLQEKMTAIRKRGWERESEEEIVRLSGWKLSEVREAQKHLNGWSVASLDQPLANAHSGDDVITMLDLISCTDDVSEVNIQEFSSYLWPLEQDVLRLRLEDFSQVEIAESVGKSQAHISRILIQIGEKYMKFQEGTLERSVVRMSKVRGIQAVNDNGIEWFIDEGVSTNPTIGINGQGMHLNSRAVHTLGCKAGQCLRVGFDSEGQRIVIQVGDNGIRLRALAGEKSGSLRLVNKRLASWLRNKKLGTQRYALYSEQNTGLHYIQLERHA